MQSQVTDETTYFASARQKLIERTFSEEECEKLARFIFDSLVEMDSSLERQGSEYSFRFFMEKNPPFHPYTKFGTVTTSHSVIFKTRLPDDLLVMAMAVCRMIYNGHYDSIKELFNEFPAPSTISCCRTLPSYPLVEVGGSYHPVIPSNLKEWKTFFEFLEIGYVCPPKESDLIHDSRLVGRVYEPTVCTLRSFSIGQAGDANLDQVRDYIKENKKGV